MRGAVAILIAVVVGVAGVVYALPASSSSAPIDGVLSCDAIVANQAWSPALVSVADSHHVKITGAADACDASHVVGGVAPIVSVTFKWTGSLANASCANVEDTAPGSGTLTFWSAPGGTGVKVGVAKVTGRAITFLRSSSDEGTITSGPFLGATVRFDVLYDKSGKAIPTAKQSLCATSVGLRYGFVQGSLRITGTLPTPPPPIGLVATALGNASVSLKWNASQGADSYTLRRSLDGGSTFDDLVTTTAAPFVDYATIPGNSYLYEVHANNAAGSSPDSSTAGATLASLPTFLLQLLGCSGFSDLASWSPVAAATSYEIRTIGIGVARTVTTTTSGPFGGVLPRTNNTIDVVVIALDPLGNAIADGTGINVSC